MTSPVEQKLANLLVSLRETAAQSNQLADQVEKAILALYEVDEPTQPEQPESKPQVVKVKTEQTYCNGNIVSLIKGESFTWDMSVQNITDLRDYAFIEVHANTGSTVSFTYATATNYTRMCFMKSMTPDVSEELKAGKIYVVHNAKRNGKNFWDFAIECPGEKHQILARAKKLAKLFAELKKEGKL